MGVIKVVDGCDDSDSGREDKEDLYCDDGGDGDNGIVMLLMIVIVELDKLQGFCK